MGAETTIYVQVLKTIKEVIEVQAVTLKEAREIASSYPNVSFVLGASYERDDLLEE